MRKIWVTRNKPKKGFLVSNIRLWKTKPEPHRSVYIAKEFPVMINMWQFEQLFGFTPEKGSCEQMELSLTKIE